MQGPRQLPRIVSAVPGRMRLHVAAVDAEAIGTVEHTLTTVRGIRRVEASSLTGNVLIHFDPRALTPAEVSLLVGAVVHDLVRPQADTLARPAASRPGPYDPKPPWRLPPLPDLIAVIVAIATAESPIGLLLAGVDALKLIDAFVA